MNTSGGLALAKPVIGITTRNRNDTGDYNIASQYVDAVRMANGIPLLMAPGEAHLSTLLSLVDGLIFSGGGDIDPEVYGGDPHPHVLYVNAERDAFELALAKLALETHLPLLGICRGMQVCNVVCGGKLHPHVPDLFDGVHHFSPEDRKPIRHDVEIVPGTRLAQIVELPKISVVSWHHQAICGVPSGWRIAARSEDELIEAIEHEQHPWAVAIQWHPESSAEEAGHRQLFESFIAASARYKAQRIQLLPESVPLQYAS